MDEPFVPVPEWLDPSKEVKEPFRLFPLPSSLEFLLGCFNVLYSLGMTDKQVAELTSLFIILSESQRLHVPLTEQKASTMGSPEWFLVRSRFYQVFRTLEEQVRSWVEEHLPRTDGSSSVSQRFWSEDERWVEFFLKQEKELKIFKQILETTRIRFAQHCFKIPVTGVWDGVSVAACKKFQTHLPKVVIPWKKGNLNGFTYKILAQAWKRRNNN